MSHEDQDVSTTTSLDSNVVTLRPRLRTEDCIELMELALAFGWQPFNWEGDWNRVEGVPLELALQRAKSVLMTDDRKISDYRLSQGMIQCYPVVGICTYGLRGVMIERFLETWERGELIKMLDDLIRAERRRCEAA